MNQVLIHKVGSVLKNLNIGQSVAVTSDFIPSAGLALACEVIADDSNYNQLELPTGRLCTIKKGDNLALCLGNRSGANGIYGKVPEELCIGDEIHVLSLGGVCGLCLDVNRAKISQAITIKVLGAIQGADGKALHLQDQGAIYPIKKNIQQDIPLMLITGTGMDSGKTTLACNIIKNLSLAGLKIACAKVTGIGTIRDVLKMVDHGAQSYVSFIDLGYPSTADLSAEEIRTLAHSVIEAAAQDSPDLICLEFGDGIYGRYGVMNLITDPQIQARTKVHIGCSGDIAGAIHLKEKCQDIGLPLGFIGGPATDSAIAREIIAHNTGLPLINAYHASVDTLASLAKVFMN